MLLWWYKIYDTCLYWNSHSHYVTSPMLQKNVLWNQIVPSVPFTFFLHNFVLLSSQATYWWYTALCNKKVSECAIIRAIIIFHLVNLVMLSRARASMMAGRVYFGILSINSLSLNSHEFSHKWCHIQFHHEEGHQQIYKSGISILFLSSILSHENVL